LPVLPQLERLSINKIGSEVSHQPWGIRLNASVLLPAILILHTASKLNLYVFVDADVAFVAEISGNGCGLYQ